MAVPISNVTRRVVYAPSGTGGQGPYAFTFEILANTDIAVYKDDVLLTLTTHYTVTINSNGTGSVTITAAGLALAPTSPSQYAIVGNRTISRSTDFTTGGDFFANVLNDELDQQTIFAQQNAEGLARALSAPQTDPTTINMTLPRAALRAGKLLAFNATTGNAEAGPDISNFTGIYQGSLASAPSTRFDTTALQAGDLYFDTMSDSMRVYTGGAWQEIAPEMAIGHQAYTASGGQTTFTVTDGYNTSSVYVYLNGVLLDAADYTATNGTSIVLASSAVSNDTVRVVTYFNPVDTVSIRVDAQAAATAAATSATNAATSATNASNSASSAATQASNASTSAFSAATQASNASTSATNAANSATNASNSYFATVAIYDAFDDRYLGAKSSDPTVDNDSNPLLDGALYWDTTNNVMKVYDLGGMIWRRTTPTSSDQANINTVSGIQANVTTVAGISSSVITVAGISSAVTSVNANSTNINTVANDITNVNAVGGSIANVNTTATNIASVNTAATNIVAIQGASTEASNAAASAVLASDWATKTTGAVSGGEYSAKYHAQAAASSASAAAGSATTAANTAASVNNTLNSLLDLQYFADWGLITDAAGTTTDYGSI